MSDPVRCLMQILMTTATEQAHAMQSGIHAVDRMTGAECEAFLATLLQRVSCLVEPTGKPGDGADLVIKHDGQRRVVQAKRQQAAISVAAIQAVVAAKRFYRCRGAMVIINSTFSKAARTLAEANGVTLWDRTRLLEMMDQPSQ